MCIDCPDTNRRTLLTASAAVALLSTPAFAQTGAAEEIVLRDGDVDVSGLVFRAQRRHRPIILAAHGNPGFDPDYAAFCRRIAGGGFNVVALDWPAGGPPFPQDQAARAEWVRNTVGSSAFWERGAARYSLALEWCRRQRVGDDRRVFGFGICGGGVVLANCLLMAPAMSGLVLFHAAARMHVDKNAATPMRDIIDLAAAVNCPVQGHYGVLDPVARIDDAREYESALLAAGKTADFHYYPGAGHGFVLDGAPFDASSNFGYVPLASEQAISRAQAFVASASS
jgi:carboxymethylenebutenolidase